MLRPYPGVTTRVRLAFGALALLAALAVYADATSAIRQSRAVTAAQVALTPRQVLLRWFDAWNANDAHGVCSYYGEGLLRGLGGNVAACARGLGALTPLRFQIASEESDGTTIIFGVLAGTSGGAVYLAREHGAYRIVGLR